MSAAARRARSNGGETRRALRARLEARRGEIEQAALTRIAAIADTSEIADPAYAEGLRRAIPAAIGFGIETIDSGEASAPPIPVDLLAQARLAARNRIPLDTVLRRYFAGYSLLGFHLIEEASRVGLADGTELKHLLSAHAGTFDRLLAAVSEEHARETASLGQPSGDRRRAERIERLLAGEPVDTSEIPYDFEGWHLGLVVSGKGAGEAARTLAEAHDCRLLSIERDSETWAWLGARSDLRAVDPDRFRPEAAIAGLMLAFGEPGRGLPGWRMTHRQAAAALPIGLDRGSACTSYADVAVLAAVRSDDLARESLWRRYMIPLEESRDGGASAKNTLGAYFAADRNVSSAAAALGVSRNTVAGRLSAVEKRLGCSLATCASDLRLAMELRQLERAATSHV